MGLKKEPKVGAYRLEQIILDWKTDRLTTEQAVGQILLLLQQIEQRVGNLEAKLTAPPPAPAVAPSVEKPKRSP